MWYNATVRDSIVGSPVGSKILIAKADVKHTSIGPTWWVFDGKHLRQFPESFGGERIYKLVLIGKPFSDQVLVARRCAKFLAQYWKHRNLDLTEVKHIRKGVKL